MHDLCPPHLGHLADCPNRPDRSALPQQPTAETSSTSEPFHLQVEEIPRPSALPPGLSLPPDGGQQLAMGEVLDRAPVQYHSTAWGGTVTEPSFGEA